MILSDSPSICVVAGAGSGNRPPRRRKRFRIPVWQLGRERSERFARVSLFPAPISGSTSDCKRLAVSVVRYPILWCMILLHARSFIESMGMDVFDCVARMPSFRSELEFHFCPALALFWHGFMEALDSTCPNRMMTFNQAFRLL